MVRRLRDVEGYKGLDIEDREPQPIVPPEEAVAPPRTDPPPPHQGQQDVGLPEVNAPTLAPDQGGSGWNDVMSNFSSALKNLVADDEDDLPEVEVPGSSGPQGNVDMSDWQLRGTVHPDDPRSNVMGDYQSKMPELTGSASTTARLRNTSGDQGTFSSAYFQNVSRIESGSASGNYQAHSPLSSASGRWQFIDNTWRRFRGTEGAAYERAYQAPPHIQDLAFTRFTEFNAKSLQRAGLPVNDTTLFMAHNLGDVGARKLLNASPTAKASSVIGIQAARNNPKFFGRNGGNTVAQALRAYERDMKMPVQQDVATSAMDFYRNIPRNEVHQFLQWNPDPVGNHEENLSAVNPTLAEVVRKAQEFSPVEFVVGSGLRDKDLQKKAIEWGWSKTMDSDHLHGNAVDLWPVSDGAVKFDRQKQLQIVEAMRLAAIELGIELDVGADWSSFEDLPHFGIRSQSIPSS